MTTFVRTSLNYEHRVIHKNNKKTNINTFNNVMNCNEGDEFKINKLSGEFRKALMQARQTKGLTQKELASKLNVKPAVINSYESGKVVPQGNFIHRLNHILNVKLPKIVKST